jgi:hypothetical protein
MAALRLSVTCDEPYGSNCPLGDEGDNVAHVCNRERGHDGGCGGCDCGT